MEFPVLIADEQQFNRMACAIAREAAREATLKLMEELAMLKPELPLVDCQFIGGRSHVDNAIKKGELKIVFRGKHIMVDRVKFREWLKKDKYLIETKLLSEIAKMKIDALKKENEKLRTDSLIERHGLRTEIRLLKRDDRLKKIALKKKMERIETDTMLKINKNRRKIADLKTVDMQRLDKQLTDDLL